MRAADLVLREVSRAVRTGLGLLTVTRLVAENGGILAAQPLSLSKRAPVAAKVPEITLLFWVIKLLTTAGGEATSDYLALGSQILMGGGVTATISVNRPAGVDADTDLVLLANVGTTHHKISVVHSGSKTVITIADPGA